jgi:hypothetical protein
VPGGRFPVNEFDTICDPIVRMGMPGCRIAVDAANHAARTYFRQYAPHLGREAGVLCDVLDGPHTALDIFCPFELAYQHLTEGTAPNMPAVVAFGYNRGNGTRPYDLFVAHLLSPSSSAHESPSSSAKELVFRLLPIPAAAIQLVTADRPATDPSNDLFGPLPSGLEVSVWPPDVRGLPEKRIYSLASTAEHQQLTTAKRMFEDLIHELRRGTEPREVWDIVTATYSDDIRAHAPVSVRDLFDRKPPLSAEEIEKELRYLWKHPLDAPVLTNQVLPKIWDAIRNDTRLEYLPKRAGMDTERVQYLRCRLPLAELEEQDRYLNWLPPTKDGDQEILRAEMYEFSR